MLVLIEMTQPQKTIPVLALYENEVSKSLRLNRSSFRRLVEKGLIPYTYHADGKRRIYLLEDLNAYLNRREKFTILDGNPPVKGQK
jgi:hypothetical protein